ncbi:DUF1203 domain-containing protein [Lichenihabitans psoromatis]|uniref:DUF1203 domain-containing protein n=1 Tax=Lichenihabitans psoromatis TaxID=2528642 RepID=UPI0010383673|nr:DUF1203 domain-containing protein [Lichenihabitans psoromatis]
MSFRVTGLSPDLFKPLFGLGEADLARQGVIRFRATEASGMPDRIELRDARPGEDVLLLNYVHQPADTPYRASHAIFVLEGESHRYEAVDAIPPALRARMLSLRGFGQDNMLVDAMLTDGREAEIAIERLMALPSVAYIQAHYATFGCYAARIDRN